MEERPKFLFNGQAVSVDEGHQRRSSVDASDVATTAAEGAEGGMPPLPPATSSSSSPMRHQKSILSMMNSDSSLMHPGDDVNELWDEIEGFLNRPPPSINSKTRTSGPIIPASQMSLPKLMKERSRLRKSQYAPPPMPPGKAESGAGYVNNIRSKVKSGSKLKRTNNTVYGAPQKTQKNNLDMSKVEEAMAYVEKLKEGNVQSALAKDFFELQVEDNHEPSEPRHHNEKGEGRKNRPTKSKSNKGGGGKKKSTGQNARSCYGGPPRGRNGNSGKKGRNVPADFDTRGSTDKHTPESQAQLDYHSLAQNFEQGIGLRQLQEELEASKQSMAQSRGAIQRAAQEWFKR